MFESSHWPCVDSGSARFEWVRDIETLILSIQTAWTPASVANLPAEAYFRAVRYCFDTYRSGILVSIRDGKVVLFIPYVNDTYINRLFPPRAFPDYARLKQDGQGAKEREDIIRDASRWWFNGHMVCNVRYPPSDYQVKDLFDMIQQSCRGVRSADFVINKRDCPMWFVTVPRPFHLPVLSPYTSRRVHDLPMVLGDDWRLATLDKPIAPTPWKERPDSRAVFRGSSTGKGLTPETNARMALYKFASSYPAQFDVRLTRINNRDQLVHDGLSASVTCDFPRVKDLARELDASPRHYLTLEQQCKTYKLAIYIRGHQAASRLGALLAHGFCVIYYRPPHEDLDAPGCDPWMLSLLENVTIWKQPPQPQQPQQPMPQQPQQPQQAPVVDDMSAAVVDRKAFELLQLLSQSTRKRARLPPSYSLGKWLGNTAVPSVPCPSSPHAPPPLGAPPPPPLGNVCFVESFEEMVECVSFMQRNDSIAETVASNGLRLSREKIHNRDFLLRHIHSLLLRCECPIGDETHPLFGATNLELITKASCK